MTSDYSKTYTGHLCDGWIDNLEPTLYTTLIYFLIQRHHLKNTINNFLQEKNDFMLKMELITNFRIWGDER